MIGELLTNGKDAYNESDISMGDKFFDALGDKAGLKEYITNSDRMKDGIEYRKSILKMDERTLTLTFTITGDNQADFISKKDLFHEESSKGDVVLSVPKNSTKVYHSKLRDTIDMHIQNVERTFCKVGVKLIEPSPRNRE